MSSNQHTKAQTVTKKHIAKKHIAMRRCVLCRTSKPQSELIRFYKTETGSWELDKFHLVKTKVISKGDEKIVKPEGRGVWICFDTSCHNPKKIAYNFKKQAQDIETHLKRFATNKQSSESENASTGTDLIEQPKFQSGGMNV